MSSCLLHKYRGVVHRGAEGTMAPPYIGRSVSPISTRGDRLYPPNNIGTPGFTELPTVLKYYILHLAILLSINKGLEKVQTSNSSMFNIHMWYVSCDDFLPRTHAHSHTRFSAARTSHARVHFAKIPIAHARARVRFWVCDLPKFAHAHSPLPKMKVFFEMNVFTMSLFLLKQFRYIV